MEITQDSLNVFLALARDAGNWSGTPMLDGDAASRGNITQLKRAALITTFSDRGDVFANFTEQGVVLAAEHGITIS